MLIGELSTKTGLSRDTIRFYEKQGLILVSRKERRANNYKEYSEEALKKLLAIKRIKGFGFTLNEAVAFLELIESNAASCENVSQKMLDKVCLIDEKIKELEAMKYLILDGINNCSAKSMFDNCPLLLID